MAFKYSVVCIGCVEDLPKGFIPVVEFDLVLLPVQLFHAVVSSSHRVLSAWSLGWWQGGGGAPPQRPIHHKDLRTGVVGVVAKNTL